MPLHVKYFLIVKSTEYYAIGNYLPSILIFNLNFFSHNDISFYVPLITAF